MKTTIEKHKKDSPNQIKCSIITLSDTRTKLSDDLSGNYIENLIKKEKHEVISRDLIPDEKEILLNKIEEAILKKTEVILINGGTGLNERDITVETVENLFEKKIAGFGEIFRLKSYEEIGAAAILSRATAGLYKRTLIFSMPGSPNAVKTAMQIIIGELSHFVHHAQK